MKKILIGSIMLFMIAVAGETSNAQVSVSVNIGLQPDWGPVGFDYVEYYYLPEYEVYYYVPNRQFVYFDGVKWVFVSTLPPRFGTVNLYSTYKVVINEPKPYLHHDKIKVEYAKYKSTPDKQEVIRDSKDPKYVEARKNAEQPHQKTPEKSNNKQNGQKDKDKHPDDGNPKGNDPK